MNISILSSHFTVSTLQHTDNTSLPDVYLVGDVLASLSHNGDINDLSLPTTKRLLTSILANEIDSTLDFDYLSCVGSFSIIVYYPWLDRLYIACSTTCPSPYIFIDKNLVTISFDENNLLQKIGPQFSSELVDYIGNSHQLVVRPPLSFFGLNNSLRVPAGHEALLNLRNFKLNIYSFVHGNSTYINLFNLSNTLRSILSVYNTFYKGDIGVSFSGGLDSSCLASILSNMGLNEIPMIHLDYHGSSSLRSTVSFNIAKYLGFTNILHLPRFGSKVSLDGLINTLSTSFMQLPNEMYIGNPSQFYKNTFPKYMITGQGADSIYAIDTFAPATELTGTKRIKQIVNGCDLRLDFSAIRINKNLNLAPQSNLDSTIVSNKFLNSIIASQSYTLNEHAPYRPLFPKKYTASHQVSHSLSYNQTIQLLSSYSSTQCNPSSIYRYLKWIRANANVANQYHNFIPQQSFKLTPFLEGPVVRQFFNYEISEFECLSVKPHFETLFSHNCGLNHRRLIEQIIAGPDASNYGPKADSEQNRDEESNMRKSLFQHLYSKFRSSVFSKLLNYDKNSLTPLMRTFILFNHSQ